MAPTRRMSIQQGLLLLALTAYGVIPSAFASQNANPEVDDAEAAPIVIDMAAPLETQRLPPPAPEPSALGVYRTYIQSMEASAGAFAPGLTEQLLGLGLNLQALDRHEEAEAVLKRGVHVSRVQSGLYSADQIPLLRAEIRSLTAMGRFDEVDERQRYLARVESEALEGTPASIAALLDQAAWAEQAWDLRVGEQETHPEHLARSWEYYRLAYNQSSHLFGEKSLALLKPLEGMLRLQYDFASLQRDNTSSKAFDSNNYRQSTAVAGVYRRGEAVLYTIYGLKRVNGASAGEQAHDLARLGDWAWWMGRRTNAYDYYEQAWRRITPPPEPPPDTNETADAGATTESGDTALSAEDGNQIIAAAAESAVTSNASEGGESAATDAPPPEPEPIDDPVMRAALFETATPLPDIDSLRPLPPFSKDDSGPIVVQFRVNDLGKVRDLERLVTSEVIETAQNESEEDASSEADFEAKEDSALVERLFRKIRRTRFRPRYAAGQPIETDMIIWSFDLEPPRADSMALQPQ